MAITITMVYGVKIVNVTHWVNTNILNYEKKIFGGYALQRYIAYLPVVAANLRWDTNIDI